MADSVVGCFSLTDTFFQSLPVKAFERWREGVKKGIVVVVVAERVSDVY